MRVSYLILIMLLAACSSIKKQTNTTINKFEKYNNDTLAYIQKEFIDKKEKYINKEFKLFDGDLQLKIESQIPGLDIKPQGDGFNELYLYFDKKEKNIVTNQNSVYFLITWATPISGIEILNLGKYVDVKGKSHPVDDPYEWTQSVKNFYNPRIIKNIQLWYHGNEIK